MTSQIRAKTIATTEKVNSIYVESILHREDANAEPKAVEDGRIEWNTCLATCCRIQTTIYVL